MSMPNIPPVQSSPAKPSSITLKLVAIGAMIVALLIPAAMIDSTVSERRGRRDAAVEEVQQAWSHAQFLQGPILAVPVRVLAGHDKSGKPFYSVTEARFLPETLDVDGRIDTETRYRGIYKTAVYTADLVVKGRFQPPDFKALNLASGEPQWDQLKVVVGLGDLRGIKNAAQIVWDGKPTALEPGNADISAVKSGLAASVPAAALRASRAVGFSVPLTLRGSSGLWFLPSGRTTTVSLKSAWTSPSFGGQFLPDRRRIGPDGFSAAWKVLHINRSLPGEWTGETDLESSRFGVSLLIPVDHYASVSRSTKYAVLFIFLTFLAFFLLEFFQQKRLHPVQYLMVGSALVLFYLLLLSLSEQAPFGVAYVVASASVIAVVSGYAHGVLRRSRLTAIVAVSLTALYGYLYVLLQLEDYALLLGSLGLLFVLASVMYLTRGVDWYDLERAAPRG